MHGQENAAQRCKEVAVKHAEEHKRNGLGTTALATGGGIGIWRDSSNKCVCKPVVAYAVLCIYVFIVKETVKRI